MEKEISRMAKDVWLARGKSGSDEENWKIAEIIFNSNRDMTRHLIDQLDVSQVNIQKIEEMLKAIYASPVFRMICRKLAAMIKDYLDSKAASKSITSA